MLWARAKRQFFIDNLSVDIGASAIKNKDKGAEDFSELRGQLRRFLTADKYKIKKTRQTAFHSVDRCARPDSIKKYMRGQTISQRPTASLARTAEKYKPLHSFLSRDNHLHGLHICLCPNSPEIPYRGKVKRANPDTHSKRAKKPSRSPMKNDFSTQTRYSLLK